MEENRLSPSSSDDDLQYLIKGSKVEVSSSEEGFRGSYFPATIVDIPNPNSFVVEYDSLFSDDDLCKKLQELVQVDCIRPLPPSTHSYFQLNDVVDAYQHGGWWVGSSFQVNDVVDAYQHGGWWVGVIDKIIMDIGTHSANQKYAVRFEDLPHCFEFDHSDLRAHFDWVAHKWVSLSTPMKEIVLEPEIENDSCRSLLGMETNYRIRGQCTEEVSLDVATPSQTQQEELTPERCPKKLKVVYGGADNSRTTPPAASENEEVAVSISGPQEPTCSKQVEVDEQPSAEKSLELVQHLHGGSSVPKKNKRRRTKRIVLRFVTERGQMVSRTIHSDKECIDRVVGATDANDCTAAESDLPETGEVETTTPISPQCENQIQHSGLQELTANNTIEVSSMCKEATAESSNTKGTKEAVDVNKSLPFVKSSTAVWKVVESFEVFQKTPQKPHFRPLQYEAELSREGLAIAKMVSFSIAVDSMCKLRHDDPESKFDMILEALLEFEKHGFDIEPLQRHLNKLRATKASIAQLEVQVQETEIRVMDKRREKVGMDKKKVRMERKIHELAKKMDGIFKKLKVVEEQKVGKDSEIVRLKSTHDNISERLKAARREFQKLAGGPSENE